MVAATRSERIGPWPSRSSFSTPMGTLIDCSTDELHCRGAAEISVDHSPVGRRWIGGESPSRILRPDSCCYRIRRDGDGPPSSRRRSPPRRQPGIGSKRSVKQQRAGRWAACPNLARARRQDRCGRPRDRGHDGWALAVPSRRVLSRYRTTRTCRSHRPGSQ